MSASPRSKAPRRRPLVELHVTRVVPGVHAVEVSTTAGKAVLPLDDVFPDHLVRAMSPALKDRLTEVLRSRIACYMAPLPATPDFSPFGYAYAAATEATPKEPFRYRRHWDYVLGTAGRLIYKCVCGIGAHRAEHLIRHLRSCPQWLKATDEQKAASLDLHHNEASHLIIRKPKSDAKSRRVLKRVLSGFDPLTCVGCGSEFATVKFREQHEPLCPALSLPAAARWLNVIMKEAARIEDILRRRGDQDGLADKFDLVFGALSEAARHLYLGAGLPDLPPVGALSSETSEVVPAGSVVARVRCVPESIDLGDSLGDD